MGKFLLAIALMGLTLPLQAAYVLKQHSAKASADTNTATTTAADYSTSTFIVVGCITLAGAGDPTISDSSSNTWTHLRSDDGDNVNSFAHTSLWYKLAPTVSASQTFTCTLTGNFPAIFVSGWTGNVSSSVVDQQCGQAATSAVSTFQPCASTVTPTLINELLISVTSAQSNAVTNITVNSSFTITDFVQDVASTSFGGAMAYLIETAVTGTNPTFTYTGATDGPTANIASFFASTQLQGRPLGIF